MCVFVCVGLTAQGGLCVCVCACACACSYTCARACVQIPISFSFPSYHAPFQRSSSHIQFVMFRWLDDAVMAY